MLSSAQTVFPDGEDAGRAGPPGATKPSDWQGEGDDPGLLGKSLPELWWRWGGHTRQVFLSFTLLFDDWHFEGKLCTELGMHSFYSDRLWKG